MEFEAIELGMAKTDVIALAGAPSWSDRKEDQDRWFYYLVPDDRETERVVYFENGKVVEKGLRRKPLLSPEELDSLNKSDKEISFKPRYTQDQLRQLLKEEAEKAKPKRKEKFEKI